MDQSVNLSKPSRLYALVVTLMILGAAAMSLISFEFLKEFYAEALPNSGALLHSYPVAKGKDGRKISYELQTTKPEQWRHLNQISKAAVAAVLASEDGGYYTHNGYEPEAIRKAWALNRKLGRFAKGGSTITQQVVKNIFLSPEKTISRKLREIILAVQLERTVGKRKILETYLNIAEWGPGIYGIEQAARTYFAKSAAALTAREGAILAFMLPNPKKYRNSLRGEDGLSEFGQHRVSDILNRLWKTGKISDDEFFSSSSLDSSASEQL